MTNCKLCKANSNTIHNCESFLEITEAKHFDENKPALQYLLAIEGLSEVAKVGMFGATKYGQFNYKDGMPWMKLAGSISRHLTTWILGEDYDHESKCHHLAHLVFDGLMLLDYWKRQKGQDDRYVELPKSSDTSLPY